MHFTVFSFAAFILCLFIVPAQADTNPAAEKFIQAGATQTLEFISQSDKSETEKKKHLDAMLSSNFDLKTIGRFVLGRYWRQLDQNGQKRYQSLFEDYVVNVYSQRFNDYSGEEFEVVGSRIEQNKDTIVFSRLYVSRGNPVNIDWRVRERNGAMRVLDVIVEGVSMSLTQRSEFDSVIQRNGAKPEALLAFLQQQNEKQAASSRGS